MSTISQAAAGRQGRIGSAISFVEAANRAGVPIWRIGELARAGVIFELGGRISEAALPIIRELRHVSGALPTIRVGVLA